MTRYEFIVDVEIDETKLSGSELAAIKRYVGKNSAIKAAVQNSIDANDPELRDIDPLKSVKVKVC